QVDGPHRIADEVRRPDAEQFAKPCDMPDPHAAAVDEVDHLRRTSVPQHVRGQHAIACGECGNIAFPTKFGTGPELTAVQQHHRIALAGFQVAGGKTVHQHRFTLKVHHLIAIGLTGDPTAPTTLSGGATSWNS